MIDSCLLEKKKKLALMEGYQGTAIRPPQQPAMAYICAGTLKGKQIFVVDHSDLQSIDRMRH